MASPRSQNQKFYFVTAVQPCHDGRASAEAMAVEKQRGGALPRLDRLSFCEVGWALKSHLCLSPRRTGLAMQDMLKGCSTFSRGEEFRNLLPFPLSPGPTKAEKELSTTSAHGDPVSPELMHQVAVDVWMFLVIWSLNWQFGGRQVKSAESSQPALPQAASAAQQAAFRELKRYVEDFVRGPVVPSEDWASLLKTAEVDYNGEEIRLPEAFTWAQTAPALPPSNLTGGRTISGIATRPNTSLSPVCGMASTCTTGKSLGRFRQRLG